MRNILYAAAAAAALAFAPFTPGAGIATATPICDPVHPAPGCESPVSPTKPVTAPTLQPGQAECLPPHQWVAGSCEWNPPKPVPTREAEPGDNQNPALNPQPLPPGHSAPGHSEAPPDPCVHALCNNPNS
jgi:hypothetical protein